MVDVHLLVNYQLNILRRLVSCNFGEKFAYCERHVFFFKSIRIPVPCIHAAEIDYVLYHLVDQVSKDIGNLVIHDVSVSTKLSTHLLELVFVENGVMVVLSFILVLQDIVLLLLGLHQLLLLKFLEAFES